MGNLGNMLNPMGSVLKESSPEYSLEGLMLKLKLKLQSFGHLMQRTGSLEKTLMLGEIEGRRRRGWQRIRWSDGLSDSMDMSLSKLREMVKDREAWRVTVHGLQSRIQLSNWTELMGLVISGWPVSPDSKGQAVEESSLLLLFFFCNVQKTFSILDSKFIIFYLHP